MRAALAFLLLFVSTSAYAADRCFDLTPKTKITMLASALPSNLVLLEQTSDELFPGTGRKRLSWVGQPSKEFYSDMSFWETSGGVATVLISSGFDGFVLTFELSESAVLATAQPFADIPGERPTYDIQIIPVKCPQA